MSRPGPILFLDLARTLGWALGAPGGAPTSGAITLSPGAADTPPIFAHLERWVLATVQEARPALIVYEAPPYLPSHSVKTMEMLFGYAAIAQAAAWNGGCRNVRSARVHDIRKYLLGANAPRKAGDAKKAVQAHLIAQNHIFGNDPDRADAVAGWLYATGVLYPAARDAR